MPAIRVLFADDQLPYDDERDEKVLETIYENIGRSRGLKKDKVRTMFHDDQAFFRKLVQCLESEKGIELVKVRSHTEALNRIERYSAADAGSPDERIDAAIIDLSWWGDPDFDEKAHGSRDNKGFRILEAIQRKYLSAGVWIPTIAYSQNFYDRPGLMSTVLERGALPVPKISRQDDDAEKRQMGYEALYSALRHQMKHQPANDIAPGLNNRLEQDMRRKQKVFERLLYFSAAIIALALLVPIVAPASGNAVPLILQTLVGAGSGGLLLWASRDQHRSQQAFLKQLQARAERT